MSAYNSNRNISIFNDQKQFKNENEELAFARYYNQKLYGRGEENGLKKEYMKPPASGFQNTMHSDYLNLRIRNPNYTAGNPITHEGKTDEEFRPAIKRHQNQDIDNFNAANQMIGNYYASPEGDFKSSSKRIDVKPSQTYEHFQKRELKTTQPYSDYVWKRNPIIQGDGTSNIQTRPRNTAGDQKVSQSYQKMQNSKYLLPADRLYTEQEHTTTSQIFYEQDPSAYKSYLFASGSKNVPRVHTGANCKDALIGGGYSYKDDKVTSKCTDLKPSDRENKYGQLNYFCDYRKRTNLLEKEEKQAKISQGVYQGKRQ